MIGSLFLAVALICPGALPVATARLGQRMWGLDWPLGERGFIAVTIHSALNLDSQTSNPQRGGGC